MFIILFFIFYKYIIFKIIIDIIILVYILLERGLGGVMRCVLCFSKLLGHRIGHTCVYKIYIFILSMIKTVSILRTDFKSLPNFSFSFSHTTHHFFKTFFESVHHLSFSFFITFVLHNGIHLQCTWLFCFTIIFYCYYILLILQKFHINYQPTSFHPPDQNECMVSSLLLPL